MLITDLLFALFSLCCLPPFFPEDFRSGDPGQAYRCFFIIIFLSMWAIGAWLSPFGPGLWSGFWLPYFLMGLVVSLLLAASVVSGPKRETTVELIDTKARADHSRRVFWILVAVLIDCCPVYMSETCSGKMYRTWS